MAEYLYRVREHDTTLSICLAFDLTYEEFAHLNPDFNLLGHRYGGNVVKGELVCVGHKQNIFHRLRIAEKRYQR